MTARRFAVLSVLLFGSLWGLIELGVGEFAYLSDAPRAPILTAFGVLFMVLARGIAPAPGSTLALAAVASLYKVLQHPVWGCKLAALIVVGAVFEAGFTLHERHAGMPAWETAAGGAAARAAAVPGSRPPGGARPIVGLSMALTFVSFVLFGYFAKHVLLNPYWMAGDKLLGYQLVQGPIASILAAPAAWAGVAAAARLIDARSAWGRAAWIAYRSAAIGSGLAGVAAALALRY